MVVWQSDSVARGGGYCSCLIPGITSAIIDKKEYANHQSSPKDIAERSARNKARRAAVKRGANVAGKDLHHKKALRSGGSKSISNTRVRSIHANRAANGHHPGEKQKR